VLILTGICFETSYAVDRRAARKRGNERNKKIGGMVSTYKN
jgi:hypothetical protein